MYLLVIVLLLANYEVEYVEVSVTPSLKACQDKIFTIKVEKEYLRKLNSCTLLGESLDV